MENNLKQLLKPKTQRNKKIFELYTEGESLEKIGSRFNISRQRAYQIFLQEKNRMERILKGLDK